MNRFDQQWANENAALENASAAVEAAWHEESAAAQRLRDAQTATSVASHDLSLRQLERIRAQKKLLDARKRLENLMATKGVNSRRSMSGSEHHGRRRFWLIAPLVAVLACALVAWQWTETSVRVCSTSMTDGVARSLVRAYHQFPYHYTVAAADDRPCDVRFNAARS